VADHGKRLPGDQRVRCPHEAVHDGGADAVLVLEQELDRAVVDHDDREPDPAGELLEQAVAEVVSSVAAVTRGAAPSTAAAIRSAPLSSSRSGSDASTRSMCRW